jgi:FtsP/CotA-like multicopper oxidase with cupredoxin domain
MVGEDRLIIGVSETYDVVVTIPAANTSYEFFSPKIAPNQLLCIGGGIKQLIAPLPKLKYFEGMKMMNDMMNMNGTMNDMGMQMSLQKMDMNTVMYPEIWWRSTYDDARQIRWNEMDMKSDGRQWI